MSIPILLDYQIAKGLGELQIDTEHQLSPSRRLAIYQALWPSLDLKHDYYKAFVATSHPTIPIGHRRYGYLGILTARHVLPIWDQSVKPIVEDMPRKMLALAEGVLKGIEKPSEVNGFYVQDFWYSLETMAPDVKYGAWRVLCAAYEALGMSLGAPPVSEVRHGETNEITLFDHDAAWEAVIAYSVIDDSEAGDWWERHFIREEKWDFDLNKRLEFWTWWLTEAIPAAWEAAEQPEAE